MFAGEEEEAGEEGVEGVGCFLDDCF